MKNQASNLILLLITTTLSTSLSGTELNQDYYDGLQLAWVRIPPTSTKEDGSELAKPKPKPVPGPKTAPKPTTAPPPPQPGQVPLTKPVQAPISKPAVVPLIRQTPAPVSKPAQVPTPKPIQVLPVAKPVQSHPKGSEPTIEWLIGLGADFGGEALGQLTYSDGSTATVNANKGIAFNLGVILPNGQDSVFSTQFSMGYKMGGPRVINSEITWSVTTLEMIEYYRRSSLRMGLGISYHINPQLSVNVPDSSYVDKYYNALGLVAQIGWAPVKEHFSVDLRYTSVKFQGSDVLGPTNVDGSVAGIYTSFRF